MTSKDEEVKALIAEQAAEWFVSNDQAPLDAEASAALVAWLRASPEHVEELLGVASIARDLHMAGAHPESSVDTLLARATLEEEGRAPSFWSRALAGPDGASVRRWQGAAIAVLAVVIVGLPLWILRPVARVPAPAQATVL